MAIFHLQLQVITRSRGRSSVACAAYRAGVKLTDDRQGLTFNFSRRKHVCYQHIMTPNNAPLWLGDRAKLWNAVETQERRKDSQLCRELHVALPHELSREQQIQLLERYARNEFVSKGLVVDMAIHANPGNCHAHIMVSMRKVNATGFGAKCRDMNGQEYAHNLRERWARTVNSFLMARGHEKRIDHRSKAERLAAANTSTNNNKEHLMTQKPTSPVKAFQYKPSPSRELPMKRGALIVIENSIATAMDELPPEIFDYLHRYLEEKAEHFFPQSHTNIEYDQATQTYSVEVDGLKKVTVSNRKITCETGSDDEVSFCIQGAIDFGWKRIRLSGTEDFRRRAYIEAVKRGFNPQDIDGYLVDDTPLITSFQSPTGMAHKPQNHPFFRKRPQKSV